MQKLIKLGISARAASEKELAKTASRRPISESNCTNKLALPSFCVIQPLLMAISFALGATQLVMAEPGGEFPGRGSYTDWKQAADLSEDGVDYAKRGNFNQAVKCYDEAIKLYPDDASFYYNKATALRKNSRSKDSLPLFRKAIELEPDFYSAWYNMGNALQDLHDYPAAETSFRRTIKLDTKHMHAWFNLGENLMSQKRLPEAREAFSNALELPCTDQDKKDIIGYLAEIDRLLRKASPKVP